MLMWIYYLLIQGFFFQVIKSLDPRQGNGSSTEIFSLKNQLSEKDNYIHFLEVCLIYIAIKIFVCVNILYELVL